MKCKLLFLLLTLLCSGVSAKAQVRFTDDPNTAINMDIEAKSESAILNIQTFSRKPGYTLLKRRMFHHLLKLGDLVIKLRKLAGKIERL